MSEIKRFEDLTVWQVSRKLTNLVYSFTKEGKIVKDYGFIDQIRRASVSFMNNIAEGYERGSNKDFVKFLFIARGSVGEVRNMLYLAVDLEYIKKETFDNCYKLCVRSSQLCWGLIKHLKKNSNWKTGAYISVMTLLAMFAPRIFKIIL